MVILFENREAIGIVESFNDVTELTHTQDALRTERDKLRNVLFQQYEGVGILRSDHTVEYQNEALVRDVEYKPTGYSYFLRGNVDVVRRGNAMIIGDSVGLASIDMGEGIGPAVQSALHAAQAIIEKGEYDLNRIAKYSVPGFFRNRS